MAIWMRLLLTLIETQEYQPVVSMATEEVYLQVDLRKLHISITLRHYYVTFFGKRWFNY